MAESMEFNHLLSLSTLNLCFVCTCFCRCSLMAVFKRYNFSIPLLHLLQESVTDCNKKLFAGHVYPPEGETDGDIFKPDLKMKSLLTLNSVLGDFLTPLTQYLEFIVYFVMNESQFFDRYLREKIEPSLHQPTHSQSSRQSNLLGFMHNEDFFAETEDIPEYDSSGVPSMVSKTP